MKVIIVGAGIIGLSTAWRLATSNADVVMLDPRAPGQGATMAALAALWPASPLKTDPFHTMDRDSLQVFEAFTRELADYSGVPITYRRLGRIEILNSPKAIDRARKEVDASRGTLELIDYPAAKSSNPGLAPFAHGALRCSITAQVRIQELLSALLAACLRAGVEVIPNTPATSLHQSGDRVAAVETLSRRIDADAVLVTAGAWTPAISPLLAGVAPVRPAKGQGLALAMPPSRPLTTLIKFNSTYLIPWDDEILVGSTTEPEAGFDETPTPEGRQKLLAGAAAIIPELASAPSPPVLRHWAGLRPQNPIKPHHPIMGPHPKIQNLFLSTGHYKTGIALAPLTSQLMASCILDHQIPAPLVPFLPRST